MPVSRDELGVDALLLGHAVVLKLQVKIAPAKDPLIPQGGLPGPLIVPPGQGPGDFPRQAGGKGDKPLVVLPQQVQVHPGLAVKALHPGLGDQGQQVVVAGLVLAEQHQVAVLPVQLVDLVKPGAPGHIHLAAQNGLDAPLFCRLIKFDHAVHTAVVGDGHRRLAHFLGGVQKPLHAAGAVEQAVFRVYMQVGKGHRPLLSPSVRALYRGQVFLRHFHPEIVLHADVLLRGAPIALLANQIGARLLGALKGA